MRLAMRPYFSFLVWLLRRNILSLNLPILLKETRGNQILKSFDFGRTIFVCKSFLLFIYLYFCCYLFTLKSVELLLKYSTRCLDQLRQMS